MFDGNVFNAMQAEPRPHYDSDDVDSSKDMSLLNLPILSKIFWKRI